jgi:hypothetical protein
MISTIETLSVVCLTEDQEHGDLILDLMVDGINMVSLVIGLFLLGMIGLYGQQQHKHCTFIDKRYPCY